MSKYKYGWANVLVSSMKTFPLAFERMQDKFIDVNTTSFEPEASNLITHSHSNLHTITTQIALSSKTSLNLLNLKSLHNLSSTSLSPQHFANDRVIALPKSGKWNLEDKHLFTLTFNSWPLYLYKLAFLLKVIHQENQSYNLLLNNCYHLVRIVASTVNYTQSSAVDIRGKLWCQKMLQSQCFCHGLEGHNNYLWKIPQVSWELCKFALFEGLKLLVHLML